MSDIVKCDDCRRARPIDRGPVEIFGKSVVFGPGGPDDMFVIDDEQTKCKRCIDDDLQAEIEGVNVK